jgi:hypothetical protein
VVSFTPRSLYLQGNSPWYPMDRRLGGPQSRSGRGGEEKNSEFSCLLVSPSARAMNTMNISDYSSVHTKAPFFWECIFSEITDCGRLHRNYGRFTPVKDLSVPIELDAGWAPNRCGRGGKEKNSQPLPGIEPRSFSQ